ncbi:MAG TPA: hypothetical protein VIJ38_01965, partial [Acidobacteriaceae bacterium]
MWPFIKDTLHRSWHVALQRGSSTWISVIWLGIGATVLAFVGSALLTWSTEGRDIQAFNNGLRSWKSPAATIAASLFAWIVLFAYSVVSVLYTDHQALSELSRKKCPTLTLPMPVHCPAPAPHDPRPTTRQTVTQHGHDNQANPVIINGKQT